MNAAFGCRSSGRRDCFDVYFKAIPHNCVCGAHFTVFVKLNLENRYKNGLHMFCEVRFFELGGSEPSFSDLVSVTALALTNRLMLYFCENYLDYLNI